ncbi:glycosyltransferase [Terrabacter sp. 2TAF16]|uniref:glycosyltransferase n=1 Tax=Terrabacter sp. 2TAF16 TaxID=3233008 RepID=UPI003F9793F0
MSRTSPARVTILLPVYNGEKFLGEQIDSLLNQSFTDFILLLWDDSSSDSSLEICKHYAARDPRIRVGANVGNLGLVSTMGMLMSTVETDLFALCDQDDVWDAHKLETSIDALEGTGSVLVYSNVRTFNSSSAEGSQDYWASRQITPLPMEGSPLLCIFRNPVLGHTIVARREVATQLGNVPSRLTYYEPWVLASAHSLGRSYPIEHPLGSYRVHERNVVGPAPASVRKRLVRVASLGIGQRERTRYNALVVLGRFDSNIRNVVEGLVGSKRQSFRAATSLNRQLRVSARSLSSPRRIVECLLLLLFAWMRVLDNA